MIFERIRILVALFTAGFILALTNSYTTRCATAQVDTSRKALDHSDYDKWNSLGLQSISNDGKWMMYSVRPGKGNPTLFIREVATQTQYRIDRASSGQFSFDSRFVVCVVRPDSELLKKLAREKKKPDEMPKPQLEILDLENGQHTTINSVQSFTMPEKASGWIAFTKSASKPANNVKKESSTIRESFEVTPGGLKKTTSAETKSKRGDVKSKGKEKSKKEKEKKVGGVLVLRNLITGMQRSFPNVTSHRFSKYGKRLAYTSSANEAAQDGVFVFDLSTGENTQIISGRGNYRSIAFNEKEDKVAFLTDRDDFAPAKPNLSMYLWEDWQKEAVKIVDHESDGIPKGWWLASVGPSFTEDGRRLLFNTQPKPEDAGKTKEQLEKEAKAKAAQEPKAKLDLWHWQDPMLQPQQLLQANRERNRSFQALFDLETKKVVQLADDTVRSVFVDRRSTSDVAVGIADEKYLKMRSWEVPGASDIYLVDLKTGKKTLVLENVKARASLSPAGKFLTWWDPIAKKQLAMGTDAASVAAKKIVEVSAGITTSLANELHDTPSPPRSYGVGGWLENDEAMWLYDRFDVWQVDPTGNKAAECITGGDGRTNSTRYRYVSLDREIRAINPDQAIYLSAFNEKTKASGYCKLDLSRANGQSRIEVRMILDERIGRLAKAKDADTIVFSRETFRNSPDVWTSTLDFKNVNRISNINPQQRDYRWGSAELVNYTSSDGVELNGILYKPDNFDANKKYPMMVYFYERSSDGLHRYVTPAATRASINYSFYVSRGYLVFVPDIPYKTGYPGQSCYNAIVPGIQSIVKRGFVNEKKIGVQGHSWGGYQIAYLVTRTNLFACAESGAPVSNMTSAYGGIRWASGMSRMFQYEQTQSRIGAPLWQAQDLYIENSPIFFVENIQTPLLILHNDNDGAVPWYQGIELFVAMRRLNKPAWMVNYNGEPHGINKPENRLDFTKRMQQFFDHYLQDAPAPKWLVEGIPAVNKGKDFGFETVEEKQEPSSPESVEMKSPK